MLHGRIIFYLLQFYLFAVSGALSYLSLRAWLDPALSRRKREDPYRVPRWTHVVRGLGLFAIAIAAIIGALREGATGISLSAVALLRIGGYAVFLLALPKSLRREKVIWLGAGLIAVGEALLVGHTVQSDQGSGIEVRRLVSFAALSLSGIGLGLLGLRMVRTILRVRLVDRLVISFAVFGLLLAQMVTFLVIGVFVSMGADMTQLLGGAEKPLLATLTSALVVSALIGYILARDLTRPVTELGRALRAIGDGNLSYRVNQARRLSDDEMYDLASEINRMASQLKAADELRSDFFSFVSHELRTPLTAIQGFITTLESVDDFSAEERAEMYGIVHDETDRLLRMINELLDLSRVQAGKPLNLNLEWFDIGRRLTKVANILAADAQRHRIELALPEIPVWVNADPDKVQQIVINLMSNAVKYSPSGGVVSVSLVHDESSVTIAVADEGVGMTSDQCAHVFDKFYRVAEEDTDGAKRLRRVEGAGIGLYLTRALVEAHSGSIAVESEPGNGSVFTVTLPKQARMPGAMSPQMDDGIPATDRIVLRLGLAEKANRAALLKEADRVNVPHLLAPSETDGEWPEPAGEADNRRAGVQH